MRNHDRMFFLYGNKLCHWLVKDLATRTTWECGANWWCWNHDRNIHWTLWSALLWNAWLGISLEIRCVIQRLIGVLKLGLSPVNLEGMMSVFLQLERSEPTTWEVTSAWVQKHNLSTMLSRQANNDSFSNSNVFALSSNHSICSFKASILTHCQLT